MQRIAFFTSIGIGLLLVLALAGNDSGSSAWAQKTLTVGAGVGTDSIAGNVYTPSEVTVHIGDTVQWIITSDEPHAITFGTPEGPDAEAPPPFWPVSGFEEHPPGSPDPTDLGTVEYDGTGFVNTGVIGAGWTASVTFTAEGQLPYICTIHPGMEGVVNVVPEDQPATTQEEADAQAAEQESAILAAVEPLEEETLNTVFTSEQRSDGTTVWTIAANAVQDPGPEGAGTGYLALLRFIPDEVTIKAGDTVRWVATAAHTVTFLEPGQDAFALGAPFDVEAAKPSETYDGESFYNSGPLALAPGALDTFELTFDQPGVFVYICLIHVALGHTGTITVEGDEDLPIAGTMGPSGGSSLLWKGMALGLLAVGGSLLLGGVWMRRVPGRQ